VREQLTKMADEPRDSAWAAEMEMEIQENEMSQGPDKFMIRDVECRSSIRAVETASLFGMYIGPSYSDPLHSRLTDGDFIPIWGYETDPYGARVTVSVQILLRR
jgi:hypothetical protein